MTSLGSDTSGLRVRIRDTCGWEYDDGHLDIEPFDLLFTTSATACERSLEREVQGLP